MNLYNPLMLATAETTATSEAAEAAEAALETLAEAAGTENIKPGVIEKFLKELPDKAFSLGVKVVLAIVILVVMWQVIRVIGSIIESIN